MCRGYRTDVAKLESLKNPLKMLLYKMHRKTNNEHVFEKLTTELETIVQKLSRFSQEEEERLWEFESEDKVSVKSQNYNSEVMRCLILFSRC